MVQEDHAIADVLLQAVAGERALALLARDDGGDALFLEPAEQPAQLGPQNRLVGQAGKERLDRVEDDAFGADRLDHAVEPHEQAFEVVFAGLLDLAAFDADVIHGQLLAADQLLEIEAEGGDVLGQVLGRLLEGHEDARLAVLADAVDDELHRQERLAAAGPAADQRGPPARQAAVRDLVQPADAGRAFLNAGELPRLRCGSV